jgi:aminobenzoyl-glutamate utilization protein B
VISNGGDQPNVVPPVASVWYFFREMEYPLIKRNYELGVRIAEGAAMMTDTEMSYRILGAAWPRNFNKVIAETTGEHIEAVGLPQWSDADQSLARAVQREMGSDEEGLATDLDGVEGPPDEPRSGGSDDIGDISWNVPTITLRFPSNIPGLPGHHWSSAIAMATPIAHKGATAGAKVLARTALDLFSNPEKVDEAWTYFRDVQTSEEQYQSFLSADDTPATHLNARIMQEFRPQLEPFYFDPERFDTYLEQLGITYPTLRQDATGGGAGNR